jgi:hypothetical protein
VTIDERLRRGLQADLDPRSDAGLEVQAGRVLERARRRRAVRRAGTTLAIVAIAVVAFVVAPRVLDLGRSHRPADPRPSGPTEAPTASRVPDGTYRMTVFPEGRADDLGVVGRWNLTFADHVVSLGRVGEEPAVGPIAYVEGAFVTHALSCGLGPGRYAWGVKGSQLQLSLIDDPCPARRYVFLGGDTGHVWFLVEPPTGG